MPSLSGARRPSFNHVGGSQSSLDILALTAFGRFGQALQI
jgi:hypothetical protein